MRSRLTRDRIRTQTAAKTHLVLAQEPVFIWVEPDSFLLDFFGAGAFDFALLDFFSVLASASSWRTAGAAVESFLLPLEGLAGGCCCESDSVTEALLELLDLSRDLLCRLEVFDGAEAFEVPGSSGLSASGDRRGGKLILRGAEGFAFVRSSCFEPDFVLLLLSL